VSAWVSLLKKEINSTKSRVLWGLVIVIAIGLLDVYLANYYGRPGMATILAVIAIVFHMFYLAIYMLKSLSNEWSNAHLWLHLPSSGWALISAKLASGLIAMLVSFGITCIFAFWVVSIELKNLAQFFDPQKIEIISSALLSYSWLIALMLIVGAIYNGLWAMMISVAMASTRNVIKKGRFFIGVGVFLIPTWLMGLFSNSHVYDALVNWGTVNLPLNLTALDSMENVNIQQTFYAGEILFYTLVMAAVFYLCGWLLDNKVEV